MSFEEDEESFEEDEESFEHTLRVVSCKDQCEIRLEDPNSGDLFVACFVNPGQRENAVESVLDSSRYFVLKIEDAFVGLGFKSETEAEHRSSELDNNTLGSMTEESVYVPQKWKGQIEKDLPRTFPGHPALDEDGRNSLRRWLLPV